MSAVDSNDILDLAIRLGLEARRMVDEAKLRVLALEVLPFDLLNQRRPVEMQELGCPILDPAGLIEGLKDQLPFKIADGCF